MREPRQPCHVPSGHRTVWAWDFDPATGEIDNRRVFVRIAAADGVPDRATVDSAGFVWIAHRGGWRTVRYDPGGRVARTIMLPVAQPTCPTFGGPGLDILFVTSASIRLGAQALAAQPQAGGLFGVKAGVKGLPEARFRGPGGQ